MGTPNFASPSNASKYYVVLTGQDNKYIEVNGTFYKEGTHKDVIDILEDCRVTNTRIVLDYGDTETGESWGEIHDITGTVGRSNGEIKVPLLIHNVRSIGGGSILTDCIIGIKTSKGKRDLYKLKTIKL